MIFHRSTSPVAGSRRTCSRRYPLLFIAILGLVAGCDEASNRPTAVPATISGHVYQRPTAELGEPMIADVLITIEQADGSQCTTRTDGAGFYKVSALRGVVSISAAKAGYQTNQSRFDLSSDT